MSVVGLDFGTQNAVIVRDIPDTLLMAVRDEDMNEKC